MGYISRAQEESEKYEIYSIYLNAYIDANDDEKRIFIGKRGEFIRPPQGKKSKPIYAISKFNLKTRYILIEETQFEKDRNGNTRKAIAEKYPDFQGMFRLSKIDFNESRTEARFYVEYDCMPMCSNGAEMLLERENGSWKLKERFSYWVQ